MLKILRAEESKVNVLEEITQGCGFFLLSLQDSIFFAQIDSLKDGMPEQLKWNIWELARRHRSWTKATCRSSKNLKTRPLFERGILEW